MLYRFGFGAIHDSGFQVGAAKGQLFQAIQLRRFGEDAALSDLRFVYPGEVVLGDVAPLL
ncbi:MAG: hypothetical protein ABIU29_05855 [Chthoniobacterales bacterium]